MLMLETQFICCKFTLFFGRNCKVHTCLKGCVPFTIDRQGAFRTYLTATENLNDFCQELLLLTLLLVLGLSLDDLFSLYTLAV